MHKPRLLAPGPTPVAAETALAMAVPLPHHRGPEFKRIFDEVRQGLKPVFATASDVLLLTSSGTGAMEASVANLLSPGDSAIAVRAGKFGERWSELLVAYGVREVPIEVPWGGSVDPAAVARAIEANPGVRAVLVQASETSTGALHPVRELAALTRSLPEVALVVDGITAVGVFPLPMDEWGIDVLMAGSQKAFRIPPGLAMIALSDKAWSLAERARSPRFYFDLRRERASQAKGQTAWTPAITLVLGLRHVLAALAAEGLDAVHARHALIAEATRAGVRALGLELVASAAPSPALTAAFTPPGIDAGAVVRRLRDQHGVVVSGGQDQLKGRILRIGHLGYVDGLDIVTAIAALELALRDEGAPVALGAGLAAVQEVLGRAASAPPLPSLDRGDP